MPCPQNRGQRESLIRSSNGALPAFPPCSHGGGKQDVTNTNFLYSTGASVKPIRRGPRHRAPKDPRTPGERIWAAREDNDLTQAELAARLQIKQQTVASWEKGKSMPVGTAWDLLRRILGWTREALETGKGYQRSGLPRVAESSEASFIDELPPLPPGAEVFVFSDQGLIQEIQSAEAASHQLKEAVKAGRPVWLVLGSAPD